MLGSYFPRSFHYELVQRLIYEAHGERNHNIVVETPADVRKKAAQPAQKDVRLESECASGCARNHPREYCIGVFLGQVRPAAARKR